MESFNLFIFIISLLETTLSLREKEILGHPRNKPTKGSPTKETNESLQKTLSLTLEKKCGT